MASIIYRVRKTVCQMLHKRAKTFPPIPGVRFAPPRLGYLFSCSGYTIPEDDLRMEAAAFGSKALTVVVSLAGLGQQRALLREPGGPVLAQLRARLADRLRVNGSPFLAARTTDSTDRIVVFFPSGAVVAKTCKAYADTMQTMEIRRGILVVSGKFSSFARSAIDELAPQIVLETFREEELRVDITEHELVPEHQVLSDGEKDALLKRYKLSETKLPRIQLTDPVARFYGMQRGEVVKIIRPSETAGRYVTYRIVM
ncbi:NRPB5A [Symbiodinium sp. KB8]|nr:NRPB5A [Symbiodinium sp. KB8]